jgi:hypothetical protein
MLTDYFLTVFGAVQKEKKHSQHFKAQHYELNPVWQKAISRKKWINPRHLLLTVLITIVLSVALERSEFPDFFAEGILGCLFVFFAAVIGRHVSNILIFRRLAQGLSEISGQVTMTHSLSLSISTYQYLVVALPVFVIAFFNPTPFVFGGVAGVVLLFAVHGLWILRHKRETTRLPKTESEQSRTFDRPSQTGVDSGKC